MIACLLYLLLLLWLIWHNGFFGIFTDDAVEKKQVAFLFLLKASAIPAFYLVYQYLYGGLFRFDAGIFYLDISAVNALAWKNPLEYLKLLLGLQDDSPGSYVFNECLVNTKNWDNGRIKDYFYNDNRILIRIHSFLHFIAFRSYFVHALFSCFLSFIGIMGIYKAFRSSFKGREFVFLIVICSLPSLWFYTGALLKEGLTLFVMGTTLRLIKISLDNGLDLKRALALVFFLLLSLLLKPYLLAFSVFFFGLFFLIQKTDRLYRKILAFFSTFVLMIILVNLGSFWLKERSLMEAALARQRVFADAATGGIFLVDKEKFVRLDYDSSLVKKVPEKKDRFTIRSQVPYIYWEHTHQQDTLFCLSNADTLTEYDLVYQLPKSGSNIALPSGQAPLCIIFSALYYSLFHPFFFNAGNALQLLASFENLVILISLLFAAYQLVLSKKDRFLPLVFLCFALCLCLLVGITTPNSGAIFRYRGPAVIFILLAALYYLPPFKTKPRNGISD